MNAVTFLDMVFGIPVLFILGLFLIQFLQLLINIGIFNVYCAVLLFMPVSMAVRGSAVIR